MNFLKKIKKVITNNLGIKLLAITLAILLWLIVRVNL